MSKTAFITGASSGIGAATARALAELGYDLVITGRRTDRLQALNDRLEKEFGVKALVLGFDVRDRFQTESAIDALPGHFRTIDVLVNNAGISFVGLMQDMSDAQWSEILNTNLSSVFYCCRSAIGHMVSQKSGKIINISSMWGTVGASCEAAYSATKSGMNGLTKALAKELAPSNVQVNAIACGVIDTAMNAQFSEEERDALREEIPAGRFANSEEVAELALTLASGHSYLTGQIIGLDGGYI